jgi:hypothetical protein
MSIREIKILQSHYEEKLYFCPYCESHFYFELPASFGLRLRQAGDSCPCRLFKKMAKMPQPKIDFITEKNGRNESKIEIIITPVKKPVDYGY